MNRLVFLIFMINVVVLLISGILSNNWQATMGLDSWYIDWDVSGLEVGERVHTQRPPWNEC